MSRFNTLYRGEPADAAEELEGSWIGSTADNAEYMRVALINALRRIDALEKRVANLRKELSE